MRRFMSLAAQSLVALLIGGAMLVTNLHAQDDAMTISVPFAFTVGTQSKAPGTYQFKLVSSQFLLSVTNVKTGEMEVFSVHPQQQRTYEERGHLAFRKAAGHSFLNEVHFRGTDVFSEVVQAPRGARSNTMIASTASQTCVAQR